VRVLHVDPERGWGGGEVQVAALLDALARRGHCSTLAAPLGSPLAKVAEGLGIRVVPLAVANALDVVAAGRLRRLVPGHDVVHFHTARAHALAPACRGLGARLIVTRRMDYRPRGGPYARWLYSRVVDAVIAISERIRDTLRTLGVPAERIRLVPSGVDADRLLPPRGAREALRAGWGIGAREVVVLAMGALVRRKGHDLLLAAASRCEPRVPLRVVLCGEGPERSRLARQAAALQPPAILAGFRQDVAACLAAADIVAMPSRHEGLGVAALEAMAAAKPVVAARVGGLAEVVRHGETGLVVPPDDVDALAGALTSLVADGTLRERLGSAGRSRVVARYSVSRMAAGTIACYQGRPWPD